MEARKFPEFTILFLDYKIFTLFWHYFDIYHPHINTVLSKIICYWTLQQSLPQKERRGKHRQLPYNIQLTWKRGRRYSVLVRYNSAHCLQELPILTRMSSKFIHTQTASYSVHVHIPTTSKHNLHVHVCRDDCYSGTRTHLPKNRYDAWHHDSPQSTPSHCRHQQTICTCTQ